MLLACKENKKNYNVTRDHPAQVKLQCYWWPTNASLGYVASFQSNANYKLVSFHDLFVCINSIADPAVKLLQKSFWQPLAQVTCLQAKQVKFQCHS